MRSSRSEEAEGVSLIEIVIAVGIFAMALVPLIDLVVSSSRISVSATRMLDATLYGQTLLQALAELEPTEFPPVATGEERLILDGATAPSSGGGPRWQALMAYCALPPVFTMQRRAFARRMPGGELVVRVELEWAAAPTDTARVQRVSLQTLSTPRNWD